MAPERLLLLLLWDLTLMIHGVCSVNVTCWTDYNTSITCSASNFGPTFPVSIQVHCRNDELFQELSDSCQLKPSESWCEMHPDDFYEMADSDTYCTASAVRQDNQEIVYSDSSRWKLCDVARAPPPFNIQVSDSDGFYNISWDSDPREHLEYRVRIRERKDLSKEPVYSRYPLDARFVLLDRSKLQPNVSYAVDVQAKWFGHPYLEGPWSPWSSTSEWTTVGTRSRDTEGLVGSNGYFWYLAIPLLLLIMWLAYSQKLFWQKKLQLITFIPKPNVFFEPLYNIYQGNFKDWVKPVFSEYDVLRMNADVHVINDKDQDVLQWKKVQMSSQQSGRVLHSLEPMAHLVVHLQDGGSSQDTGHSAGHSTGHSAGHSTGHSAGHSTGHSTGHVSIHTVLLNGQEEAELQEAESQSSVNSYQDGESFGPYAGDNRGHAGYDLDEALTSRMGGQRDENGNLVSVDLSLENLHFEPEFNEPEERMSLDSFVSNGPSEDGYPHVDLDTIDSGFGECTSPSATDANAEQHRHSPLFQQNTPMHSNYVKQWMAGSALQEDCSPENPQSNPQP
ncbi:interleukin 21 receptor, tandem duplicate 1 [Sphaeramia orbicularis]|uniref:Uncharacterized LOC115434975 n=1 Tax=Sphaeramia orbicularis TaxID=375764 RepID=A0A673AAU2_9TELE|nr:uncharacterized protein LOC115434975 [Sphaeramia orbicularis]